MADIASRPDARRGVLLFLLIAFGWSWAWAALLWRMGGLATPLFPLVAFVFMAGPAIGAVICALAYDRGRRVAALGLRPSFIASAWAWLLAAWAIPLALVVIALLVDWAGPPAPQNPAVAIAAGFEAQGVTAERLGMPLERAVQIQTVVMFAMALTLGPLFNMFATLTEELGWRGWLWDRWRPLGFWRGNLLIGAVWGVWHAPLIAMGYNYPGMPVAGPALMTLFCMMLAPLIGLVRERGGSVWHAGMFHGAINAMVGVGLLLTTAPVFPWRGMLGIGGLVACVAGWILVFLLWRRETESDRNVTSFA